MEGGLFSGRHSTLIFVSLVMQGAKKSAIVFRGFLLGFVVSWTMQLWSSSNILRGMWLSVGLNSTRSLFHGGLAPQSLTIFLLTQGIHSLTRFPVS